jgi:hypothetical protein
MFCLYAVLLHRLARELLGPQRFAVHTEWLVTCSAGGMGRQRRAAGCKCSCTAQHNTTHPLNPLVSHRNRPAAIVGTIGLRDREQATVLTKRGGLGCTVSGLAHIFSTDQAPTSTPPSPSQDARHRPPHSLHAPLCCLPRLLQYRTLLQRCSHPLLASTRCSLERASTRHSDPPIDFT